MTWTSFSFSVGQVLTAAQMNNLYANFTAMGNGDSGAPPIKTAAIQNLAVTSAKIDNQTITSVQMADGAIGDSKLETATSSASGALGSSLSVDITMNTTGYTFFPNIYSQASTELRMTPHSVDGGDADHPRFGLINEGAATRGYSVDYRWVV